jgi:hypothetical protein
MLFQPCAFYIMTETIRSSAAVTAPGHVPETLMKTGDATLTADLFRALQVAAEERLGRVSYRDNGIWEVDEKHCPFAYVVVDFEQPPPVGVKVWLEGRMCVKALN